MARSTLLRPESSGRKSPQTACQPCEQVPVPSRTPKPNAISIDPEQRIARMRVRPVVVSSASWYIASAYPPAKAPAHQQQAQRQRQPVGRAHHKTPPQNRNPIGTRIRLRSAALFVLSAIPIPLAQQIDRSVEHFLFRNLRQSRFPLCATAVVQPTRCMPQNSQPRSRKIWSIPSRVRRPKQRDHRPSQRRARCTGPVSPRPLASRAD